MYKEPEITNTQYFLLTDYHTCRKKPILVKGGSHSGFDHKKGSRVGFDGYFFENYAAFRSLILFIVGKIVPKKLSCITNFKSYVDHADSTTQPRLHNLQSAY